jgi:hypothetical protein
MARSFRKGLEENLRGASRHLEFAKPLPRRTRQAESYRDILVSQARTARNTLRVRQSPTVSVDGTRLTESLLFQSKRKKHYWPEDLPPIGYRPHLGESDAVGLWVLDCYRYFDDSVFESQGLEQ